jgi:hypothetical protein
MRTVIGATALALLGIVMLTFSMCSGPAETPKSPSYLPQSSHSASSSIFSVYAAVRVSSILRTQSIVRFERSISNSSCSLVRSGCGLQ